MTDDKQRCINCGDVLFTDELEIGTAMCNHCGHAEYASRFSELTAENARLTKLADKLAKACGYATLLTAAECIAKMERDEQ